MSTDEARKLVGTSVMSRDFGTKMVRFGPPHGPYRILKVTKGGMVMIEDQGRVRQVPPSVLVLP